MNENVHDYHRDLLAITIKHKALCEPKEIVAALLWEATIISHDCAPSTEDAKDVIHEIIENAFEYIEKFVSSKESATTE